MSSCSKKVRNVLQNNHVYIHEMILMIECLIAFGNLFCLALSLKQSKSASMLG